jgi:glutamate synthase (NADPH/NADH) small chain
VAVGGRDRSIAEGLTKQVVADEETDRTTKQGVWAGGGVVIGAPTVISAMGTGKRAAASIHRYLMGEEICE